MNEQLKKIGTDLGKLYVLKSEVSFTEWKLDRDIEQRKLELTPDDYKKLGANETERKSALEKVWATDEKLLAFQSEFESNHKSLIITQGLIEKSEAERRGLEWAIRGQLVEKMSVIGVQSNGRGDPAETAFDDSAGYQVDQAAFQPEDDFPF